MHKAEHRQARMTISGRSLFAVDNAVFNEILPTEISGCVEILCNSRQDERGSFVKIYHKNWFERHNLRSNFVEQYYSVSHRNVLRGLHYQKPPAQHAKLICCLEGTVLDAVVDLRKHSPTFGQHILRELSSAASNMLYLAEGLAHGFYVLSERATLVYSVTSTYSPEHDSGIHWQSAGIVWPSDNPIVSKRDQDLPRLLETPPIFLDPIQ